MKKSCLIGLILLLALGAVFAQRYLRGGFRRGWASHDKLIVLEPRAAIYVNEDSVRTARETASHSTGTPEWTNAPSFEKDVFTFARIIYKMNDMPFPVGAGLGE